MSLLSFSSVILLALFATATDLRTGRIPNPLVFGTILLALVFAVYDEQLDGIMFAMAGFGVAFTILLPGFLLGFTGGGDLKLFASLGCFLGPKLTFWAIMLYYPIAATVALSLIIHTLARRYWFKLPKPAQEPGQVSAMQIAGLIRCRQLDETRECLLKTRLPMAPAIACAVILAPLLFG